MSRRWPAVASFLHGLDGLFVAHPRPPPGPLLSLEGSAEADWATELCDPRDVILYRLAPALRGTSLPDLTTVQILAGSDLGERLRAWGCDALLLSCQGRREIYAWGRAHGIRLVAPPLLMQRRLEDKIRFHRFAQRAGLPVPEGCVWYADAHREPPLSGRQVLQVRDSLGGEGTWFLDDASAATALVRNGTLSLARAHLVRAFVPGRPLGITVFVTPGRIALSALRVQCYHPRAGASRATFAGLQWLPSSALGSSARREVERVSLALGVALQARGFAGLANVDFILDDDARVFLLECNARMSAATPQLFAFPELAGGLQLGRLYLDDYFHQTEGQTGGAVTGLPDSTFRGATLDRVAAPATGASANEDTRVTVTRSHRSGVYGWDGPLRRVSPSPSLQDAAHPFLLSNQASVGDRVAPEATLATVLSNVALFDEGGAMNPTGNALLAALPFV